MIPAVLLSSVLLSSTPLSGPGIGVGGAAMCLDVAARPGGTYQLGHFYVTDTGTVSETITAGQEPPRTRRPGVRDTPQGWIGVSFPKLLWVIPQHTAGLAPGGAVSLPVTLTVASDAEPGEYAGGVTATTVARPPAGGGATASLGVAGSTEIRFSVWPARPPACGNPYDATPAPAPPVNPATESPTASSTAAPAATGAAASPVAAPAPQGRRVNWDGLAPLALLALAAIGWWRRRKRGRR